MYIYNTYIHTYIHTYIYTHGANFNAAVVCHCCFLRELVRPIGLSFKKKDRFLITQYSESETKDGTTALC